MILGAARKPDINSLLSIIHCGLAAAFGCHAASGQGQLRPASWKAHKRHTAPSNDAAVAHAFRTFAATTKPRATRTHTSQTFAPEPHLSRLLAHPSRIRSFKKKCCDPYAVSSLSSVLPNYSMGNVIQLCVQAYRLWWNSRDSQNVGQRMDSLGPCAGSFWRHRGNSVSIDDRHW